MRRDSGSSYPDQTFTGEDCCRGLGAGRRSFGLGGLGSGTSCPVGEGLNPLANFSGRHVNAPLPGNTIGCLGFPSHESGDGGVEMPSWEPMYRQKNHLDQWGSKPGDREAKGT